MGDIWARVQLGKFTNQCVTLISGLWTDELRCCGHMFACNPGRAGTFIFSHPWARVLLALHPQHSISAFKSSFHVVLETSLGSPVKERILNSLQVQSLLILPQDQFVCMQNFLLYLRFLFCFSNFKTSVIHLFYRHWLLMCSHFTFFSSKITADSDCTHEIKRCLLLGREAMRNLDDILKSKDITLLVNVHIAKAMVFPVVMYGCESRTIKKA